VILFLKVGFYHNWSQKVQFCAFQTIQTNALMKDSINVNLMKIQATRSLFYSILKGVLTEPLSRSPTSMFNMV
jgi:hypothetical protein